MALITEDGSGMETAESLCSVATANTYHAKRGVADSDWADLDLPVREGLLRKATDYMQSHYGNRWRGVRVTRTQALDWPRAYVVRNEECALTSNGDDLYWPDDEIPVVVANACAELALRANSADLMPDVGRQTIEETVGPITTRYAAGARESTAYSQVDTMLARFLEPGTSGAMRRLVRT